MVIGFDFEADARNFALLQSLYMNVDIFFLSYRNTGGMMCVLLNSLRWHIGTMAQDILRCARRSFHFRK